MHKQLIRLVAMVMAVMILSVSTAGAAVPITSNSATQAKASGGLYPDNVVPYGKSPTTGLDWTGEYKPLMVQISNSREARPHWNLSEADIVYESILWGPGHTRYSAIYSDSIPEFVGAVRSARLHHVQIREEWDCPIVFYGGQKIAGTSIYDFMKANNVTRAFQFDGVAQGAYTSGYTREKSRVSPHNVSANLAMMEQNAYPKDYTPRNHAFKFTDTPANGYDSAVGINIPYDEKEYHPSYEYNPETRVYERSYNGEAQTDGYSEKRIVASNVIVQRTKLTYFNNVASRPVITTIGGGDADIFVGGRHIKGKWVREKYGDRTVFVDENGQEVSLLPGKTFIQIVSNTLEFSYTRQDGTVITPSLDEKVSPEEQVQLEPIDESDIERMD